MPSKSDVPTVMGMNTHDLDGHRHAFADSGRLLAAPSTVGGPLQHVDQDNDRRAVIRVPARRGTMTNTDSHLAPALTALLEEYQPSYTTRTFASQVADPSAGQRKHCHLALEVAVHALQATPRDPVVGVPAAIEEVPGARQRTAVARVRMLAHELLYHLPASARIAEKAVRRARSELAGPAAKTVDLIRTSLFIQLSSGAVFATEVHSATRVGGTSDAWMNRRVAAHTLLGSHITGYAGAVVFTPRWSPAAVHIPSAGVRHQLGGCLACLPFADSRAVARTGHAATNALEVTR
jgi:hypothetical protein